MEAKFLAGVFSFLSIFLAIYAQASELSAFEFPIIYYGDSNVFMGEPFSITCIIPVTEPIMWLKDGEPITVHNLRHGRDEHSYVLSETHIEGEKHKIEAHIKVRHALKVHEGSYKCNDRHTDNHTLHVHSPIPVVPKVQTKSPFIVYADDGHRVTESVYETIHNLTPSSSEFTRVWDEGAQSPVMPLPTQITTTPVHRRPHHHSHHSPQPQPPLGPEDEEEHKIIFINTTSFDGSPARSSDSESRENAGLINLEYLPPAHHSDVSTVGSWHVGGGGGGGGSGGHVTYSDRNAVSTRTQYPPMPDFPPPRTVAPQMTPAPPPPPPHYTNVGHHHGMGEHHVHAVTTHGYHQLETPAATFPLQTVQPTYQQHGRQHTQQNTFQTTGYYPTQTMRPLNPYIQQQQQPHQQYNQHQQQLQQQRQLPVGVTAIATVIPTAITQMPAPRDNFLVPNYDVPEHKLKVFEIRQPLVLSCNIIESGNFELTWEKNGTNVVKVHELNNRYRILKTENKFIIDRTDVLDDGTYSCVANNHKADINVVARVVVRVPSNTGVVEGEKLTITCAVVGTKPELTWAVGNLTLTNSTGRYILKPDDKGIENAVISVENVSLDDRGEFKCIGRNAANTYANYSEASDVSYVRVKGKLAALWPFLGICAEVLILCAIILIYEKRRNKTELEESDTDQQEHENDDACMDGSMDGTSS